MTPTTPLPPPFHYLAPSRWPEQEPPPEVSVAKAPPMQHAVVRRPAAHLELERCRAGTRSISPTNPAFSYELSHRDSESAKACCAATPWRETEELPDGDRV